MLRSGLVPLDFAYTVVKMFGNPDQMPAWLGVAVIPIFAWELSLAIYLIAKGFKPAATASLTEPVAINEIPPISLPASQSACSSRGARLL